MNYRDWIAYAASRLCQSDTARCDAKILLQYITGKTQTFLIAFGETKITVKQQHQLEHLLARRIKGEPIAYLLKKKSFGH